MKFDIKNGGTARIALYQDTDSSMSWFTFWECDDAEGNVKDHMVGHYIRVSEPIEVSFVPRKVEDVQIAAIAAIDDKIKTVKAKAQREVEHLEERRANLLALTYQPEDA